MEKLIEAMARAQCLVENVDPEHICYGMNREKPKGWTGPAWKIRAARCEASLAAIKEQGYAIVPIGETFKASGVYQKPLETVTARVVGGGGYGSGSNAQED